MIKVLFFAQVRELLGIDKLELEFQDNLTSAEALRSHLAAKDEKWARIMANDKLLVAVNQTISHWQASIKDGDEVAFFPPVTGG